MLCRRNPPIRKQEKNARSYRLRATHVVAGVCVATLTAAAGLYVASGSVHLLRTSDTASGWRLEFSGDFLPPALRSPDDALASAIATGDVAGAENALRRGASPDAHLPLHGLSPFRAASSPKYRSAEPSETILASLSGRDEPGGETVCLLRVAAANPDPRKAAALTRVLIAGGAHPDGKPQARRTTTAQKLALAALPSPNAPSNASGAFVITPLMEAALRGDAQTEKILLDAGADPAARDSFGFTPLIWLTWGATPSPRTQERPLPRTVAAAPPVADNPVSTQPLAPAELGLDDTKNDLSWYDDTGDKPETAEPDNNAHRYALAANVLLEQGGADVNAADSLSDGTALNYAAARGETGVVRALLAWGADPRRADADGATPLDAAEWAGHKETAAALKAALAASPAPLAPLNIPH